MTKRFIRLADEGDAPTLMQVRNDTLVYKLSHGDFAWGRKEWTQTIVRQTLEQGGMYVIEQSGVPAAMMSLSWEDVNAGAHRNSAPTTLHLSMNERFASTRALLNSH